MEFMLSRPERTLRGYEMAKELLLFPHPGRPAGPKAWISPEIMGFTWKSVKSTSSQELCEIPMDSIVFTFSAPRCAPAKNLRNPCKFHAFWGSDTLKVVCFGENGGIWWFPCPFWWDHLKCTPKPPFWWKSSKNQTLAAPGPSKHLRNA